MFGLKIPIVALGWIVWRAIRAEPVEPEDASLGSDGNGGSKHPRPRRPRPPRRGPHGEPLPLPENLVDDAERRVGARFPDLWIARVMERSRGEFIGGLAVALALVAVGARNAWLLWRPRLDKG